MDQPGIPVRKRRAARQRAAKSAAMRRRTFVTASATVAGLSVLPAAAREQDKSTQRRAIMASEIEARYEKAYKVLTEMFGEKWVAGYKGHVAKGGFGTRAGTMALEFAFAENWAAPGLPRRERSIAVISALIAQGRGDELKNHFRAGISNGLTAQDIEDIILQLIPYCGFPAGSQALEAAAAVLKEKGMDVMTAKEAGTL